MPDILVHTHRSIPAKTAEPGSRAPPVLDPTKPRRKKKCHDHGPSQVTRLVQGAGNLALAWRDGLSASEREDKRRKEERQQILAARMQHATTLKEWEAAATELDLLEGNDAWKLDDSSGESDYRPTLIRAKLEELDTARTNCDVGAMMYLIRTALSRDVGGMGNTDLYRNSYIGTKALIERYVVSALQTIESVVDRTASQTEQDPRELLEGMVYARQSFGRSALLLSGGATFGMAHIGVLKTLYEQQLLPRIMSGASAGSIVCAVLCTRKDDEVPSLIKAFPFGDLGVFEGENERLSDHLRNLLTKGSWSDISNLTRVMRSWLGDVTFQEAYNRTRRICNICVSSASIYDVPRLLNYITAPNVLIWSAVAASCSVPLIFQGHPLLMKHPATGAHEPWIPTPQQFIDGSVDNDLPMTRLAEMFNVNHFIVSQVNPHVVPFLAKDEQIVPGQLSLKKASQDRREWMPNLASIAKEEGLHRMHFLAELGVFPNLLTKLLSVMSQKYSGDINILPEISLSDLPLMLKNPTPDFMLRNCLIGERATWPKLSRIRDRLAIELALDQAVHALRARVVFSKSQVNLRRAMGVCKPMSYQTSSGAGGIGGGRAASGELSPSSGAIRVVQPPGSGEVTPSEEKTFGRRRGSGASIQLVAARHKKPFFQDAEDDQSDEEDERLELKFRPSRARGGGGVVRGASGASGSSGSGSGNGGVVKPPRLRRNAKSHGHMRGGKPAAADFHVRDEFRPSGGGRGRFLWSAEQTGEGTTEAEAGDDTAATTTAAEEEGASSPSSAGVYAIGIRVTPPVEGDGGDPASEGLQSDADPYAGAASQHQRGAGSPKRESLSKLRYSES
ncbi:acyl transferase/acyl hydrolase/lysophospholipase [Parachaetomium inaequale]|uniref:Patatin-like phospholipase domain-containing protein n=1 Tax=Parachaetomium inaequale TaxID=2588326 RepID=A0AAN6PBS0_9PEZI|nr:acyl transferase/acyl hydrolase/lysophospholipase [Parachaetomium inaequale]